jgi:hypothetical protein
MLFNFKMDFNMEIRSTIINNVMYLFYREGRELIFSCQFHTCAVADFTLTFNRQELDHACLGE